MTRFLIVSAHWEEREDADGLAEEVAALFRPRKVGKGAVITMTEAQTRQPGFRRDLRAMQLGDPFEDGGRS